MKKVAVYSLTWDRLEYTKHCFKALRDRAGYPYDHYVIDNGSQDGTAKWLQGQNHISSFLLPKNIGNALGNNYAQDRLRGQGYDFIIRMDNDCEVITEDIIARLMNLYWALGDQADKYMFSPRVEGIVHQPQRARYLEVANYKIGVTGILGGLFRISTAPVFFAYRWPEGQNKIFGEESFAERFHSSKKGTLGYVEDLVVSHYEGTDAQAVRFPEYHKRKIYTSKER